MSVPEEAGIAGPGGATRTSTTELDSDGRREFVIAALMSSEVTSASGGVRSAST
jgi:hypothetical protein